jgi:hypothetical protein
VVEAAVDIYCDAFVARQRHGLDSDPVVLTVPGMRGIALIRVLVTNDARRPLPRHRLVEALLDLPVRARPVGLGGEVSDGLAGEQLSASSWSPPKTRRRRESSSTIACATSGYREARPRRRRAVLVRLPRRTGWMFVFR